MHDFNIFGYCSFGFQSRILETNRLVCSEAKEVFYGENYWTFFVSQCTRFSSVLFQIEPMTLVLPFIRKAHIRFAMLEWLLWNSCGVQQSAHGDVIKASVREICLVLLTAPTLRTVKIIWTETCTTMNVLLPLMRMRYRDRVPSLIFEVLQPLIDLPKTSELQKSNIMVAHSGGMKANDMELAFSECVDEVIARHRSIKTSWRPSKLSPTPTLNTKSHHSDCFLYVPLPNGAQQTESPSHGKQRQQCHKEKHNEY